MDLLTFFSNVLSAFAWPSVIIVLIIVLRHHIGGLAGRLEELRLPGGTKAKFVKELKELREQSDRVKLVKRFARGNVALQQGAFLEKEGQAFAALANLSPESVVIEGFKEVEFALLRSYERLPAELRGKSPEELIDQLSKTGYLTREDMLLYKKLRDTRNLAAHASSKARVTPGEAVEYRDHARLFADILSNAVEKYAADPKSPK